MEAGVRVLVFGVGVIGSLYGALLSRAGHEVFMYPDDSFDAVIIANALHIVPDPGKTLCQGGDCCDFDFVRHETDAGDGWERSESR